VRILVAVLLIGGGASITWLAASGAELQTIFELNSLSAAALIVATTAANLVLRFFRWHLLVRATGVTVPTRSSMRIFAMGLSMSITPLYIGEFLKSYLLVTKHNAPYGSAIGAVITERTWDVIAIGFIAVFWLLVREIGNDAITPILGTGILLLVIGPIIATGVARLLDVDLSNNRSIGPVVLSTFARPGRSTPLALLSVGAWISVIFGLKLAVEAFGADLDFFEAAWVFAMGVFAGAVSLVPGGAGIVGSIQITALSTSGISIPAASTAVFLHRTLTIWIAFSIGLITIIDYVRTRKHGSVNAEHDHFDSISGVYNSQLPPHLQAHILASKLRYVRSELETMPADSPIQILDIGCGGGEYAEAIGRWDNTNVVGIDSSFGQINRANLRVENAADSEISNSRFEVASMTDLPFETSSIDLAYAINSLHHLPDEKNSEEGIF
jgi:glycosyltransferase 2 family protein